MKQKLFSIMISLMMIVLVVGCGAKSADKQKAEDAITAYQAYRDGTSSYDDAMQKILMLSTEISDKELATLVSGIVSTMAFESMNGTENTDKQIQKVKDYIENGGSSSKTEKQADSSQEPKDILYEADSFLNSCWNPVCDLDWYVGWGTSSTGGELDAEFTIAKFKDAYKDRDDIVKKVNGLPDDYSLAKQAFSKAIEEFDRIAGDLEDVDYIVSRKGSKSTLDVSKLQDYVRTVRDQYYEASK
ncbi:MAG: hypothetical protein J6O61_08775 [Butyrivibrio sp.]|uniref:hypothetical protein n=1 Tax=Butyrivibrio sp. TaxID=28121 RepID=UPI001B284523|nr:hypothetical protein [Butyrivibrio sp.]MBO6240902.1 hypothetical protein [Butyrivibrio sp.]